MRPRHSPTSTSRCSASPGARSPRRSSRSSRPQSRRGFRERAFGLRAIITNPPYQEINWRDGKGRWITHAMETPGIEYMVLLLSWSWPGAGGHASLWAKWPPARLPDALEDRFHRRRCPADAQRLVRLGPGVARGTALRMLDREDDARQAELFTPGEAACA